MLRNSILQSLNDTDQRRRKNGVNPNKISV